MKKIIILLDEWNNDKNFIGNELIELKKYFEIVIIHNKNTLVHDNFTEDIEFISYDKNELKGVIKAFFRCISDIDFYKEIFSLLRSEKDTYIAKIGEIIRYYINAELFYYFLLSKNLIYNDKNVIYYSYWNFWKCYAITKHRYRISNSKIVSRIHGYDLYKYRIPTGYQPFKKAMEKNLDKLYFISEYGEEYYHKTFLISSSNKHELKKIGTSNLYGIEYYSKSEEFNIITCSRVIELKRIDIVIRALALIKDIKINWKHFGDGPKLDEMKNLADKLLSIKSNISYTFMGQTLNSSIMEYYSKNSVDAFILTSQTEGNPVSVIEAMSFGIPIISTNICNMPNLVSNNGVLISDNPEPIELADAIVWLSNVSEQDMMQMRVASRNKWEKEYRSENNTLEFAMELNLL